MISIRYDSKHWLHYVKPSIIELFARNWLELGLENRFIMWDNDVALGGEDTRTWGKGPGADPLTLYEQDEG